jgi:catechol 2,3-dioxygenase-like lactoylglutathione lyase family enzyme
MEINGIAHIMLTVGKFRECLEFYEPFLNFMGLRTVLKADDYLYCVGGRTACGIQPASPEHRDEGFSQTRSGLHHVCFRAREREDVDTIYDFVRQRGAKIVHAPEEADFAPGYYSVLFEDPDGIRIEVNHVPGKGLLTEK